MGTHEKPNLFFCQAILDCYRAEVFKQLSTFYIIFFVSHHEFAFDCLFRLFMGLLPSWRTKKVTLFGNEWTYEKAVLCKGYECCLEAGWQTLLQTYIQMRTDWYGWPWWTEFPKGYRIHGGSKITFQFFGKSVYLYDFSYKLDHGGN